MKYHIISISTVSSLSDILGRDIVDSYTDWEGFVNCDAMLRGIRARIPEYDKASEACRVVYTHYIHEAADSTSLKEVLDDKDFMLQAWFAIQYVFDGMIKGKAYGAIE